MPQHWNPLLGVSKEDEEQEIEAVRRQKSVDLGYGVCGHYLGTGMDGGRRVCWLPRNHAEPHGR